MENMKKWVSQIGIRDFWYDSEQDIELTIRALVVLSLFGILIFPILVFIFASSEGMPMSDKAFGVFSPITVMIGLVFQLGLILGLKMRSEYGWLALVIVCSQTIFTSLFPISLALLYWCLRPKFRAHFGLERLK